MMRDRKVVVCIGTILLLFILVGCGTPDVGSEAPSIETIDFVNVIDEIGEESNSNYQSNKESVDNQQNSETENDERESNGEDSANQLDEAIENGLLQPDSSEPQADDIQPEADSELDGIVDSIGNNSIVINKTFYELDASVAVV